MSLLPFVVRRASIKSTAAPQKLEDGSAPWESEFPVERAVLSLTFIDNDGNARPAFIDRIEIASSALSHVEVRVSTVGSTTPGIGGLMFPRVAVSNMLTHRDAAETKRRSGTPMPVTTCQLVRPTGPAAPPVFAAASVEMYVLSLWEPLVPPSIHGLRFYGRSAPEGSQEGAPAGTAVVAAATVAPAAPVPQTASAPTPAPVAGVASVATADGAPPPVKAHHAEGSPAAAHSVAVVGRAPPPVPSKPPPAFTLLRDDSAPTAPVAALAAPPPHHHTAAVTTPPPAAPPASTPVVAAAPPAVAAAPPPAAPVAAPPTPAPLTPASDAKPLAGVVICLSGFQNPLRGELRDKATSLGAKLSADWGPSCTHLVCAVANTPKYKDVLKSGHGVIVTRQWLVDCALMKKRLSEAHYSLAPPPPAPAAYSVM